MNPAGAQHELGILTRRSDAEQRFQKVQDKLAHDKDGLYHQLDLLGLEADLALCVRLKHGDWLELQLDGEAADTAIRWVVYHVANVTGHATSLVTPTSCPALWWTAKQYLDRVIFVLDLHRRRAGK